MFNNQSNSAQQNNLFLNQTTPQRMQQNSNGQQGFQNVSYQNQPMDLSGLTRPTSMFTSSNHLTDALAFQTSL